MAFDAISIGLAHYAGVTLSISCFVHARRLSRNPAFSLFLDDFVSSPLPFIVATHYLRRQQPLHVPFGDVSVPVKSADGRGFVWERQKKPKRFGIIDVSSGRTPASPGLIPDTGDPIRHRVVL